jgi:hypothetical protein
VNTKAKQEDRDATPAAADIKVFTLKAISGQHTNNQTLAMQPFATSNMCHEMHTSHFFGSQQ